MEKKRQENNQHGLRERLFEAMDALRDGDIEYQDASALAKLASQIIASDQVEIDMHNQRMLDAKRIGPPPSAQSRSNLVEDKR